MPCLTSSMSDINGDEDEDDVNRKSSSAANERQHMCSTPLRENHLQDDDASLVRPLLPLAPNFDVGDLDAANANPFDESYYKIQWELEQINVLRLKRKVCFQSISDWFRKNRECRCMLDEWENLEEKTDEWERKCLLQRDIIELRKKLQEISSNVSNPCTSFQIEDRLQLENHLRIVKANLDLIGDMKTLVNEYNVKTHQLSNDYRCSSLSLEDDINSLCRVWTETQQKISRQFTTLEQALSMWSDFDKHMLELKMVLREEHTALHVLDQALKTQVGSVDVASAMQCIVKYLPEKHRDGFLKVNNNNVVDHIDSVSSLLKNTLNAEGSFSDSGISDSGSEQDIFDREKRLALLRKLARHLEAILAPGSQALLNIMKKIDEAEEEIRELQQTYRTIKIDYLEKSERCSQQAAKGETANSNFQKEFGSETCPDDPGSDPSKGRSIFWRVLRAALPFHMVIVVLLCVACLMEPNCCDTINNLNLSLSPQLRYVSGPPPT